jgi:hypothetical protein
MQQVNLIILKKAILNIEKGSVMAEITPILQSRAALIRVIREIAQSSERVSFVPALEKGIAGNLAMSQIWKCLESGTVQQEPVMNEHGHYLCNLHQVTAGQDVYLVVAVDTNPQHKRLFVLHISEG